MKNKKEVKKWKKLLVIAMFSILLISSAYIIKLNIKNQDNKSILSKITGRVILGITTNYLPNQPLNGNLIIKIKSGELLPKDSLIKIKTANRSYTYNLSDLTVQETINGKFYVDGKSITGEGEGYGLIGNIEEYPNVTFTAIIKTSSSQKEDSQNPINQTPENQTIEVVNETTQTTENSTNTPINNPEIESKQNSTEQPKDKEESIQTIEVKNNEETTINSENQENQNNKETAVIEETTIKTIGPIINYVISELSQEISRTITKERPYIYDLKENEEIEIINSSAPVALKIENNKAVISTEYLKKIDGFGNQYVGNETKEITIDLSNLNIPVESGELTFSIVYDNIEINSITTNIEVNTTNNIINQSEINNTLPLTNISINNSINLSINISINISENISLNQSTDPYSLNEEEFFILKSKTGSDKIYIVKSEEFNERIIIRFSIGEFWLEKTYDSQINKEKLKAQIELDRKVFIKNLAREFLKPELKHTQIPEYIGNYSI